MRRSIISIIMWNIADKRKRRIYPLSSPQLQRAREAKPHGVIGPELWCGTAVLRLVKGWVLTMLVPPAILTALCAATPTLQPENARRLNGARENCRFKVAIVDGLYAVISHVLCP